MGFYVVMVIGFPAWFTYLAVFAVLDVLLPVEEPVWDFVLARVLHDGHHALNLGEQTAPLESEHAAASTDRSQTGPHLIVGQLSSPLAEVNVSLPQDDMSVTSANSLDSRCRTSHQVQSNTLTTERPLHHCFRGSKKSHLDGSDGEGDLPSAIDVRVENTKNVLELLRNDQRLTTQNQPFS